MCVSKSVWIYLYVLEWVWLTVQTTFHRTVCYTPTTHTQWQRVEPGWRQDCANKPLEMKEKNEVNYGLCCESACITSVPSPVVSHRLCHASKWPNSSLIVNVLVHNRIQASVLHVCVSVFCSNAAIWPQLAAAGVGQPAGVWERSGGEDGSDPDQRCDCAGCWWWGSQKSDLWGSGAVLNTHTPIGAVMWRALHGPVISCGHFNRFLTASWISAAPDSILWLLEQQATGEAEPVKTGFWLFGSTPACSSIQPITHLVVMWP